MFSCDKQRQYCISLAISKIVSSTGTA